MFIYNGILIPVRTSFGLHPHGAAVKHTMYEGKVDVDMLNAVHMPYSLRCLAYPHQPYVDTLWCLCRCSVSTHSHYNILYSHCSCLYVLPVDSPPTKNFLVQNSTITLSAIISHVETSNPRDHLYERFHIWTTKIQ